ncbi:hypothetical protein VTL71DRAFT_16321 [Oculimacula yallundae]|uniref:Uncharacterized protein n=1 Tax=Oculimacula yallundae TaxID=86028 RepID=A0ABR4CE53_9HELO
MAVAMVVDLGLDKPLRQVPTGFSASDIIPFISSHSMPSSAEIEARRTYLGCYFLTTSICQGLRKPSNMKHNQHVKLCTKTFADAGIAETDYLIPYIIRIRQLSEEVRQAFNYDASENLHHLDCVRIEILGRAFEQQLDHMEATFPRTIWDNATLKMSFHHLRIYVNEVGFHATLPPELDLISRIAAPSWYHSAARNDCLMRCLKASKTYLDHFLTLSDREISDFVTTDLLQVVYATLILGTFSTGLDAPTLDQHKVRQVANLDYYLNSIGVRFTRLIASRDSAANIYMNHFSVLFETSKMWYSQMVHDPSPSGSPRFYFTDIIATMTGRCADFVPVEAISETSSEDHQWTEMLSDWVASSSMDPSMMSGDGTMIQFQA